MEQNAQQQQQPKQSTLQERVHRLRETWNEYPLTDIGNARRFLDWTKGRLKYQDGWYQPGWAFPVDPLPLAVQMVEVMAELNIPTSSAGQAFHAFALDTQQLSRLKAMIRVASAMWTGARS